MKSKCLKLLLISLIGLGAAGTPICMQILASSGESDIQRGATVDLAGCKFSRIICSGRVEAIKGEIEVVAQIAGRLAEVRVREGDVVEKGAIVAVLEGARQIADLSVAQKNAQLAKARLERLRAGNGEEEIAQARAAAEAVKAELLCEEKSLARTRRLIESRAVSRDDFDHRSERVEQLKHQLESLQKRYEALRRGPLAGEIGIARAELNLAEAQLAKAQVEHEFRFVRAPISGTILKLYRQTGDCVRVASRPARNYAAML